MAHNKKEAQIKKSSLNPDGVLTDEDIAKELAEIFTRLEEISKNANESVEVEFIFTQVMHFHDNWGETKSIAMLTEEGTLRVIDALLESTPEVAESLFKMLAMALRRKSDPIIFDNTGEA